MSSKDDNDNECWNVTDDIINNADCIYEMYKKTVWF